MAANEDDAVYYAVHVFNNPDTPVGRYGSVLFDARSGEVSDDSSAYFAGNNFDRQSMGGYYFFINNIV